MSNKIFLTFTILLCLLGTASAISFYSIDLSRSKIEQSQNFYIEVELEDPESNYQVAFYVDDYLLSTKNVGSGETIKSSEWDWEVDELNCGAHTARAELKRGNVSVENISMNFSVGRLPEVSYNPELPLVGKTLTLTFTDSQSKLPISGVKVDIYNTVTTKTEKRTTDSAGKVEYSPENHGNYQMTLTGRDYCGKIEFNARQKLSVDGPYPENPVVGEVVSLAIPSSVGVKLLDEGGRVYLTAETKLGGGANFTVNKSGTYTILIGEISSRYWGVNKTLVVSDKNLPRITVTPEQPVVGEPVTVKVESGGAPLELAIVTVTAPDNSFDTFTTASSGTVVYTPTAIGRYTLIVEKDRYKTVDTTFESKNKLEVDVYPKSPKVGEDARVSVKNQQGNAVGDVSLTIDGKQDSTDAGGLYAIKFTKAGTYSIAASKTPAMYWGAEKTVTVTGNLNITLTPETVEVGQPATITVSDNIGASVEAELTATKPDGTKQTLTGKSFLPEEAGSHTLEAAKTGYETATISLTVQPHPIVLTYAVEGKKLKVTLSSSGEALPGVTVALTSPYALTSMTDANGVVYLDIPSSGNYVFEVNKENTKPLYESKTAQEKIVKKRKLLLLALPAFVVIVFTLLILLVIYNMKRRKKGGRRATQRRVSESLLKPSERSSLSNL